MDWMAVDGFLFQQIKKDTDVKKLVGVMVLAATCAQAAEVATQTGVELGISGGHYQYEEPSISVKDKGGTLGVLGTGTMLFDQGFWGKADYRGAYGQVDYSSPASGSHDNEDIWLNDGRLLVGRDSRGGTSVWAPYIGLGFRSLYNDARGVTSTGAQGYRRLNSMWYVPIGAEYRAALDADSVFKVGIESDLVISSEQKSYLSDVNGLGERDITNKQRGGYGLRGNVGYGFGLNEVGVFGQYWDMNDSKREVGNTATWIEPANTTTEIGVYYKRKLW